MPEPIAPAELPEIKRLTIGETPVYLKSPLEVNGQQITEVTIKGASTRGKDGLESSVLLLQDLSHRRGEEGQKFIKPLTNVSAMEEVDWNKVGGLQYTMPDGSIHTITKDQLSLEKPTTDTFVKSDSLDPSTIAPAPDLSPVVPPNETRAEPKLARSILETYSGEPTTLTIVGLKAYETRSHDLADKAMQLKTSLGERIWKQGIGPAYFHEQARQYYDQMLKAAQSPFAEQSIKIAEAAGINRYQELLKNKNFLTRPTRQFIEWMKDTLGVQTLSQKFALEEIAHMRETGEIKERETFDREAGAIRKRFEQDVDIQDQFIRGSLGEKLTILNSNDATYKPLVDVVKRLVKDYATGDIATKKDFDKVTDQLFQKHLKTARRDVFDQAELYTSSLFEVAENLRAKASHEGGLAAIDAQLESMQVRLGMGVMGEATALVPSDVEKGTKAVVRAVDWMEKKGIIGPFAFNEATVASAVALSLSLSFLPRMGLSTLANGVFTLGGGAAVGGIFAGLREYRNLEKEYLTHIREREAGLTFSPDAKRRAWMEKFFVGQRSSDDLITGIRSSIYQADGTTLKDSLTTDELRMSMANLADAKARKALSTRQHERNRQRVGMIQFSGKENIETQRTALDLTIAQAEKDITTYLAAHSEVTGLNPVNSSVGEFITDLTSAQTRILNEGVSRVTGLDDPIKLTLNLLDQYNPEVEIMRRRFPLLGPEAKTGKKAQGLEEIFNEFRTAARGEAVKKGLQVGLTSAALGFVAREVMQGGLEVGAKAITKAPEFMPPTHIGNADFQFSSNLHLNGVNLVDAKGNTVIEKFNEILTNPNHAAYIKDGILTQEGKDLLIKQAHEYKLDFPDAIKTTFAFSGQTHSLADPAGVQSILAPKELHWDITPEGRQLILDAKDAHGDAIKQILYSQQGTPDANGPSLFEIVKDHPTLAFTPEEQSQNIARLHEATLNSLPTVTNAAGERLPVNAMIPEGMNLLETKTGSGLFDLVDTQGKHLLTNIEIDKFGAIQNVDALNANNLGLHVSLDRLPAVAGGPEVGAGVSGTFDKAVADMGSTPNEHGVWNWMLETMQADKNVKHLMPATNLTKNLFRGYEENMVDKANVFLNGKAVEHAANLPYGAMGTGYEFHELPKSLFFDQALPNGKIPLVELGKIMDKAIDLKEIQNVDLAKLAADHNASELLKAGLSAKEADVLAAAYQIGRVGNVATEAQVKMFMEYMGGAGGERVNGLTLFRPVIEQVTTSTVPASITGISGEHVTNLIALHEGIAVPELPYAPYTLLWRTPLEAPTLHTMPGITPPDFSPPEYFTYGGEQVFLTKNEYEDRRSPTLADSGVKLNQQEELSWYLSTLTEEDRAHLDVLLSQYNSPVPDSIKAVVAIPANKEGQNIYTTLMQYAKQKDLKDAPLDPSTYQMVIYDNRVKGSTADATRAEVMRFKNEHPEMNIVYLEHILDQKPTIGRIRRNLTNSILKRMEQRNPSLPSVAIISNDADSVNIPDRYVATVMDTFNHNARLDAITGRYDFPQEVYKNYPVLFATERAWQLMDAIVRHNEQSGVPQLMGANSAVHSGTLAAIGGYNPKSTLGEDLEVGWMIQAARKSDPTRFHFSNALKLETDPRRAIYKYLQGAGLLDRYTDFADNTDIRGLSWQEMATRAEEAYSREKLAESLSRMRNELYPWLKKSNPEALDRYFKRAMDFLGITFEIDNEKVMITDDSVLRAGINANLTPEQVVKNEATLPPPKPSVPEASAL
ncbi:MAG: hypothetical protein AAB557_03605 [Patescibacteria group bacterium]